MKTRLLLISMILATSAAIGDARADAQAQAAALLSPARTSNALKADPQERPTVTASPVLDAQASAAALLSGTRTVGTTNVDRALSQPSAARMSGDAQAQAAALLSGSRNFTVSRLRAQKTHGGEHASGRDPIHKAPYRHLIVVPPTHLPELARQPGEAMFLHDTIDGKTLLYIEQNRGARLAILDVTNPAHVKGEGSVQLDAPGPFDFVATLGIRAELIRFRQDQENAVLDLHKVKAPTLQRMRERTLNGLVTPLSNDGFTVTSHADADVQATRGYQVPVVYTANSRDLNRGFNVEGVREEITKYDTGTTFLLTEGGLFLMRRPVKEMNKERLDLDYAN